MSPDREPNPNGRLASVRERHAEEVPPPEPAGGPTHDSFAEEVRAERLAMLWKVTLFAAFLVWWVLVVISGTRDLRPMVTVAPTVALTLGCLSTAELLKRGRFRQAVWAYALGATLTIALIVGYGGTFGTAYAPYVFPLLVFVVGLLLPARETVTLLLVVAVAVVMVPSLAHETAVLSSHSAFALLLTLVAAGLSAQMSGELYKIAEWALENYRKERQTSAALFDSRDALQKSLARQRALTKDVQHANQELEYARRAEEEAKNFRGQFLANMSHELRTPLNAIIGFSQTMLDFPAMYDGMSLPGEYRQDMNQILGSGKHLLNIINDILDLSKVDAGKLELDIQPVDLEPVVKSVLSTAVGLVGDKIDRVRLLRTLPDPLPVVLGDPLRVRQVLLNLYSNAAKFTDAGHINLTVRAEGQEVIVAVEDTGIGIAEEDKASIFEEFRQGTVGRRQGRQGAGLGLAISQQLLRLMRGRLWFESTVDQGSTFYFALPLYEPPASTEEPEAEQADTRPLPPPLMVRAR